MLPPAYPFTPPPAPPLPHSDCGLLLVVISPMPTSVGFEDDPLKPKVNPQSSREPVEGSQGCRHVVSSDKNQSEACSCIQTLPSVRFILVPWFSSLLNGGCFV